MKNVQEPPPVLCLSYFPFLAVTCSSTFPQGVSRFYDHASILYRHSRSLPPQDSADTRKPFYPTDYRERVVIPITAVVPQRSSVRFEDAWATLQWRQWRLRRRLRRQLISGDFSDLPWYRQVLKAVALPFVLVRNATIPPVETASWSKLQAAVRRGGEPA